MDEGPGSPKKDSPLAQITVGPNVQVSKSRDTIRHAEVVIGADPNNAARLLAGSMMLDGFISVVAYGSGDAGRTWKLAFEKRGVIQGIRFVDPAIAYGPDGSVYFATLGTAPTRSSQVYCSHDGGQTWGLPTAVAEETDRPFLAVDCGKGKYRGRLYCSIWHRGKPAVYTSRDDGKTFDEPRSLGLRDHYGVATGQAAVLSDGTLVVPYRVLVAKMPTKGIGFGIRLRRSATGGETFLDEQSVWTSDFRTGGYNIIPMLAVNPGSKSFKDRMYLVWSEKTSAETHVMLTLSKDKGVNWSKPVVISEQGHPEGEGGKSYDSVLPTVAVNRRGIVGVSWYDSRDSRGGKVGCSVRFRASLDGGTTWLPSARVSEVPSRVDLNLENKMKDDWLGDTMGLTADAAGEFHVLWVDDRTGIRQVFTASVAVRSEKSRRSHPRPLQTNVVRPGGIKGGGIKVRGD
jgi:photosystem II stability/assembly factor-like uncharacterized protein